MVGSTACASHSHQTALSAAHRASDFARAADGHFRDQPRLSAPSRADDVSTLLRNFLRQPRKTGVAVPGTPKIPPADSIESHSTIAD
jgi:hypothetical protein